MYNTCAAKNAKLVGKQSVVATSVTGVSRSVEGAWLVEAVGPRGWGRLPGMVLPLAMKEALEERKGYRDEVE